MLVTESDLILAPQSSPRDADATLDEVVIINHMLVTESDLILALQASRTDAGATLDEVVSINDVFASATANFNMITFVHRIRRICCRVRKHWSLRNNALLENIGHFEKNFKPQVDQFVFPEAHEVIVYISGRFLNLDCAPGHPSFVV